MVALLYNLDYFKFKVKEKAKSRNRYNQAPVHIKPADIEGPDQNCMDIQADLIFHPLHMLLHNN